MCVLISTVLVLGVAGMANASWVASAGTTTSVSAATASLTVAGTDVLGYGYQFGGAAANSPVNVAPIVVVNTGTAPLNYSLAVANIPATPLAGSVALALWLQVASACGSTVAAGATIGTLASPPALPAGATSAAAGSRFTLCAATSLNATVAATSGSTVTATLTINGRVGISNWVAAGSGSFTQTSLVLCTQAAVAGAPVVLTELAPVGTGPFSYRVVLASDGTTVVKAAQTGTAITVTAADLSGYSSPVDLRAEASADGFATIASTVDQRVSFQPGVATVALASITCISP